MKQTKRALARNILICLLLGLALNFGVAYACAKWSPVSIVLLVPLGSYGSGAQVPKEEGAGFGVQERFRVLEHAEHWEAHIGVPFPTGSITRMQDYVIVVDDLVARPWAYSPTPILQQTFYTSGDRTWSLLPLGTTINTLFYAAILFVLWIAPGVLIRWNRARRGLCRHCAYDITGVAVCPECGTPTTLGTCTP